MKLREQVENCKLLQKKISAYEYAMNVIYYDSATVAPAESSEDRGIIMGILTEEMYHIFVNDEVEKMLIFLLDHTSELDEQTVKEVEQLKEAYDRQAAIPVKEEVAYKELINQAENVWQRAKRDNDYESFAPVLQKVFDANKKRASYMKPDEKEYDVLLDLFEKDMTQEKLDQYFEELKKPLVELVQKVQNSDVEIRDDFLYRKYPVEQQREFSAYLMEVMGIDTERCIIGESEHPFTTGFNRDDVRMTTHYDEENVADSMYSVIHEGGHALYELNIGKGLKYTCLAKGTSMGIHESQSRFFENIIGRSENFIQFIFPKMQEIFEEQLQDVTAHEFYLAVNKSQPSLIRTEADELTYSLHIMVRYEIEKLMIAGEVKAEELPELWNKLYQEYLGVEVPDDARGVLQDTHWSGGSIGYFPSYSLGSAYGAQILHYMKKELDVDGLVAAGNLKVIQDWLAERIYKYGSMLTPEEIIENCCSESFQPDYYIKYLEEKYSKIYELI